MMVIGKWECDVEQEPEECTFSLYDEERRCVVCGRQCGWEMRQWHPGPILIVSGWCESPEYHDPATCTQLEDILREAIFKRRGVVLMPLSITGCEAVNATTWKYHFYGSETVARFGIDKESEQGRTA